jgi:hypothetical protein
VVLHILAHPWQTLVERWNWKAALLSALFRGMALALPLSHLAWSDAAPGIWIEIGFRIALGGFWGALLQAFRSVRPAWLAGLSIAVLLPAGAHVLEFAALKAGHATHITTAMIVSVVISVGSLLINFGLMRRGLLVTGDHAAPLVCDLQRIPRALVDMFRRPARDV